MSDSNLIQMARKLEVSYNRIDAFIRSELRLPPHVPFKELVKQYKEKNVWWRDDEFIRLIASIRNILVHTKRETGYIMMPTEELVEELRRAEKRLTTPEKVIPRFRREVLAVAVEDNLSSVLEKVERYSFSQFPVMKGTRYAGLITENSITRWLAKNRQVYGTSINLDEVRVSDVIRYEEVRQSWMFAGKNSSVDQVLWLFSTHEPLEAVLIEEKAEKHRRLLGIVTRWDVAQLQKKGVDRGVS